MTPITFFCEATLPQTPEKIASQILDMNRWPKFAGYRPLPGIKHAEFETKAADIVGTTIRVMNRDGSTHIEEIVEWQPTQLLRLHMHKFSPPVSRMATGFGETWKFQEVFCRVLDDLSPDIALAMNTAGDLIEADSGDTAAVTF